MIVNITLCEKIDLSTQTIRQFMKIENNFTSLTLVCFLSAKVRIILLEHACEESMTVAKITFCRKIRIIWQKIGIVRIDDLWMILIVYVVNSQASNWLKNKN